MKPDEREDFGRALLLALLALAALLWAYGPCATFDVAATPSHARCP